MVEYWTLIESVSDRKECVGCNGCRQVCPTQCITMQQDTLGFEYPKVEREKCIGCKLCEKVCPILNQNGPRRPLQVFAAKNPQESIRLHSSSGGVFTALAEEVIKGGGVVFGAKFDKNFDVVHGYTDSNEGLREFQGSKYVQSRIGETFSEAKRFLDAGKIVLFSGVPCQINALRLFLRKDYGNSLICIDMVCHGVPGPGVWQSYLNNTISKLGISPSDITSLTFRDKRLGWRRFGLAITSTTSTFYQPLDENPYIQVFLKNLDLRPSCYNCPAKCGKSHSDITLADFWKMRKFHPDFFDDKGVSLLMVNTGTGKELVEKTGLELTLSSYQQGLYGNPSIEESATLPPDRASFIKLFTTKGFCFSNISEVECFLQ